MVKVIEGQKVWSDFQTSGNVGTITNFFSKQFLDKSYNTFQLSIEHYIEEISLYGLDTVFVDNQIIESDHEWYKARRGELVNYCKNNDINLVVIKNTTTKVNQTFKKAFVMEINVEAKDYFIDGMILQVPLLLNEDEFNPVNSVKDKDITFYSIGKMDSSKSLQTFNSKVKPTNRIISEPKMTSHNLKKLSSYVKKSRILYIGNTNLLDSITLAYIETMALLNSTYVVYDYRIDVKSKYGFQSLDDTTNINQIRFLINNKEFSLKKTLGIQRKVLLENTFIFKSTLNQFLKKESVAQTVPQISVITATNRKHNLDDYFNRLSEQKLVEVEVNLVTHGFELSSSEIGHYKNKYNFNINVQSADVKENLGNCLNKAIMECNFPIITKMDDDDFYFEHYLIDQFIALKYSNSDIVGKYEAYYYFEEEDVIVKRSIGHYYEKGNFILGASIMSTEKVMKDLMFADLPKAVDTNFLRRAVEYGAEIYVGHPFEMCVFRGANLEQHTWKINNLMMLKSAKVLGYGEPSSYVKLT